MNSEEHGSIVEDSASNAVTQESNADTFEGTSEQLPYDKDNPFGLSPEELRVLKYWADGESMADAYRRVMMSMYDQKAVTEAALKMRVKRFFDTYRMRQAMAACPGERGERARKDFDKWKKTHEEQTIKRFVDTETYRNTTLVSMAADLRRNAKAELETQKAKLEQVVHDELEKQSVELKQEYDERYKEKYEQDKKAWWQSLNVNVDPCSLTIYGTGQFLASVAVKEILARQEAIREQNVDVLSKDGRGSALSPTIISALKTAAAMILPFAPAPSAEDRKQMSKAAVLLGLMPDDIQENPDDYTAPIPATIDVDSEA